MSQLDQLINELCPDGVEYKKTKDCFKRLRGTLITAGKKLTVKMEKYEFLLVEKQ